MRIRRYVPLVVLVLVLLSQASPAAPDALSPFPESEWSWNSAAHLLRRAGFGGTKAEVDALHARGLEGAVDSLLGWQGKPDPGTPPISITVTERPGRMEYMGKSREERQMLQREHRRKDGRQLGRVRAWWMSLMINTNHPLRERMTLFWHGHFTSGYRDIRNSYHMYMQNTLFRRHAAGNFAQLLHDISADPAMLEYLDNNRNRKGKPNENYAREVMELFTMGEGNYGEKDIKEAARAFTGWTFRGNEFVFDFRNHDPGEKTFLGKTGRFDGDDIIEIILEQPVTAEYITRKLARNFGIRNPPDEYIRSLAKTFRRSKYELKPVLRQMLLSREFYGDDVVGTKIKGPVELIVSLYRSLGMRVRPTVALPALAGSLGQELMQPPNVKGWEGGRNWITTSHLLNRYNICGAVVGLPQDRMRTLRGARIRGMRDGLGEAMPENDEEADAMDGMEMEEKDRRRRGRGRRTGGLVYDVVGSVREQDLSRPDEIVDYFTRLLLANPPSAEMRKTLIDYLSKRRAFDLSTYEAKQRLHGLLRLIVSLPEFQLT